MSVAIGEIPTSNRTAKIEKPVPNSKGFLLFDSNYFSKNHGLFKPVLYALCGS